MLNKIGITSLIATIIGMQEDSRFHRAFVQRGTQPRERGSRMSNTTRGRWTGSRKLNRMGRPE